tara:strand:- start:36 stop:446 length:411 start_codon:yes stop_codon:yes gene_type:complete
MKILVFLFIFLSSNVYVDKLNLLCKGTIGWVIEQDFGEMSMTLNLNLAEKTGDILLPPQLVPYMVRDKGNKFLFEDLKITDDEITGSFVLTKTGVIKSISNITLSRITGQINYTNRYRQKGFQGNCTKIEVDKKKF